MIPPMNVRKVLILLHRWMGIVGGLLAFAGLHFLFGLIGFIWMTGAKAEFAK